LAGAVLRVLDGVGLVSNHNGRALTQVSGNLQLSLQ
jgi:hypothetical protein